MISEPIEVFGHTWHRLWQEDETTRGGVDPDHQTVDMAWAALFPGQTYPGTDNCEKVDWGDTDVFLVGNQLVLSSYDGHSIWGITP